MSLKGLAGLFGLYMFLGGMYPIPLQAAEISSEENLLLAMHQGRPHGGRHERHQMHHGMGRGGSGICPQSRSTAQAPDKIAQQKNPFESNSENYIKGESLYQWTPSPTRARFVTVLSATDSG